MNTCRRSRRRGLLLVVLFCLVGLAFYRGWLALSSAREPEGNKVDINLKVDADKVRRDAEKAKEKAEDFGHKVKQEVKDLSRSAEDKSRPRQPEH